MTYIAGLGSAEPSLIKNANLHPYFTTCKTPPITPFFAKTIGGTMGLLSILLRIFGDAQHSCSANGTHIAGLISEVPAKISSELPRHGRLGSPWNIPTDIGCVLGPDLAAKTS